MSATMKHCPYCSEEIQDEALKCGFCGKFLETAVCTSCQLKPPTQKPLELDNLTQAVLPPPTITAAMASRIPTTCPAPVPAIAETLALEQTAIKAELQVYAYRRGHRYLGYLELLLWSLVPAAAVLAIDALSGIVFGRESVLTDTDWFFFYIVLMIAYVSLGLALSSFVYRFSVLGITAVSLLTMLGVRIIIVPFIPPQLVMGATNMGLALAIAAFNSLFAWAFVALAIGAGVLALRLTESELQFGKALEGGNPVKALLMGLAETGLGVVSFCGWSIIHKQPLVSTSPDTFAALFLVLIVADGVRRAFAAAKVYTGIYDRYYDAAASQSFQPGSTLAQSRTQTEG